MCVSGFGPGPAPDQSRCCSPICIAHASTAACQPATCAASSPPLLARSASPEWAKELRVGQLLVTQLSFYGLDLSEASELCGMTEIILWNPFRSRRGCRPLTFKAEHDMLPETICRSLGIRRSTLARGSSFGNTSSGSCLRCSHSVTSL